jgi:taurine dioxygenase
MASHTSNIRVQPLAGAIGAEVVGMDLRQPLSTDAAQWLREVFLKHQVIFLRDQALSLAQYMAFAHAMGKPSEYPFVKGLDGYPCIIEVKKLEHETVNFGGIWHSDTTYLDQPPMGSMLLAREVPPYGGDTLFASQYKAWETLSPTMQSMIDGLVGINSSAKADVSRTREDRMKSDGKAVDRTEYRSKHPLVRVHPETGRKALYVNVAHTVGIDGLSDEESAPLLQFLFQHQVKVEFTCRFVWQTHSLAFWDNRCAQHNPVNDYHGHRRVMHRITLECDTPR